MRRVTIAETTNIFKLLADPTRFKIIALVLKTHQDLCVGEIADSVGMSQSATSHQLAKLESYGIVSPRREGQMICYVLNDNRITRNLRSVMKLFT